MAFLYLLILIIMLAGTAIIDHRWTHVAKKHHAKLLIVIAATLLLFLSFDLVGTYLDWFWTPKDVVLGFFAGPIPLEEFLFLAATTYFTIVVWEWMVKHD